MGPICQLPPRSVIYRTQTNTGHTQRLIDNVLRGVKVIDDVMMEIIGGYNVIDP